MSDLKIQADVSMSSGNTNEVLDGISNKAAKMAVNMAEAGAKAGKALDEIGEFAKSTEQKLTKAESSIVASARRFAVEIAKGSRTASDALGQIDFSIAAKGLDPAKFAPIQDALRKLETQAATSASVANKSLNTMGVSAAQTAAALRGVPAQFTDIITSLQGGQAPLTVFLQQGGQLKDMFGGAGAAAKALGGYVAGLVSPMTIAAAAVGSYGAALYQAQQQADEFTKTLIMTGNAAGMTSSELMAMAQGVASATGTFSGTSADALNKVASSGKIAKENFELVTLAAVQMQRETGQSIDDTIKQFENLAKDPVKSLLELNSKYNFLTESVYRSVKAAQDEGDAAKAAAEAQKVWASEVVARTDAVEASLGRLDRGWRSVASLAASAWNAMQGGSAVDNIQRAIKEQQQTLANIMDGSEFGDVDKAKAYLDKLIEQRNKLTGATAEQAKETARLAAADDQWAKIVSDNLTNQQKQRKELADLATAYTAKISAGNKTEAEQIKIAREYESAVAAINEKYKDRAGKTKSLAKETEALDAILDRINGKDAGFSPEYVKTVESLLKAYDSGKLSLEEFNTVFARYVAMQPGAVAAEKERIKALDDYNKALSAGSADLEKRALQLEQEAENYGLTESAIQYATIARLEEASAIAEANGAYPEHLAYLDREIEARKRLAAASASLDVKKANERAINDQAKAWENFARDIERSLTDSLMRSFEAGGDFGKTFAKTLQNTFKSMVLKVAVQAIVSTTMSGAQQLLGINAPSSSGGLGNLFSLGNSAYNSLAAGAGAGASMSSLIGANVVGAAGGDSLGALIGANSAAWGVETAAGTTAGLASTFASALPYVGLALGAASLLSSVFGGEQGAPKTDIRGVFTGSSTGLNILHGADWSNTTGGGEALAQSVYSDSVKAIVAKYSPDATYRGYIGSQINTQGNSQNQNWAYISKIGEVGINTPTGTAGVVYNNHNPDFGKGTQDYQNWVAQEVPRLQLAIVTDALRSAGGEVAKIANSVMGTATDLTATLDAMSGTEATSAMTNLQGLVAVYEQIRDSINGGITAEAVTGLASLAGGIANLSSEVSSYYDSYYSDAEKAARTKQQLSDVFKANGLDMPTTEAGFKRLVESLDMSSASGQKLFAVLMSVQGAFKTVASASATAASEAKSLADANLSSMKSATDAAYSAIQKSVEKQRTVLTAMAQAAQEQVTALQSLVDGLTSQITGLQGASSTRAGEGMAFIDQALATAQSSGYMPDANALTAAIESVKSGIADGAYASAVDQQRAQLVLAGKLQGLKDIGGKQLTEAERQLTAAQDQLSALDDLLAAQQAQIDALRGIDTSVLSVKAAIESLSGAMSAEAAARQLSQKVASSPTASAIVNAYQSNLGRLPDQAGLAYWEKAAASGASISDITAAIANSTEAQVNGLYESLLGRSAESSGSAYWQAQLAAGASVADVAAGIMQSDEYKNSHATGLERVPFDGYKATLHAGEAVVDAASVNAIQRYFQASPAMGNTGRLEALVESLTAEVQRLQAIVNDGNREARRTADAVNGSPEQPMAVEVVK